MHLKFGLREKLLFPLLLGLTIVICVLLFIWQPTQLEKAKQEFVHNQTNILKTLNPSIIQNMLANDLSALHSVFENSQIIHNNVWRHIQLYNYDKKQLYPIFSSEPEDVKALIKIDITIEENDEVFGYITLYADWKSEKDKKLNEIYQLSIFTIVLFSVIAIFSFILLTRWIYTPISKLKNITSTLSHGDYSIKLPNVTRDEIGSLTTSIDQMRDKIQFTLNELVDKEKMQRAIVESVPDAIITISKEGTVNSFNHGAEKIFQLSAQEVIGNNIKMLMPDDIASHHDGYLAAYKDGATNQSKIIGATRNKGLYGKRKDNSLFPIELTINPIIIEGEILFTGILRDITERQKIDRLKDEFVSTVSHELRTPLTAIKGALDIMTHGLELELPEQADVMLTVANRNVERLLTLINDILDISKLESGEINFNFEPLDIKQFIKNSIELNQEYAKKYNTGFVCTNFIDNIIVNVDKDRLTQVMSNLLSNAAKYSPENINIEIFTAIKNGKIRVSVKDYGAGIPEEFQPIIFNKFTQSSSGDTRQVGGTGLGLNISKMIIEKFGGEINFETIIGKETTFYFELPFETKT